MPYEANHPVFQEPQNPADALWRYMDFTKFVSLLDQRALYFARSDTLGDIFEGSYSQPTIEQRETRRSALELPASITAQSSEFARQLTRFTYINSWHLSEYESAAMWRLYLRTDEGIAVRSTFGRLRDSLKNAEPPIEPRVLVGMVRYIDYEADPMPEGNTFWPFVHKRKSFEHEREVRAVIQDISLREDGTRTEPEPPLIESLARVESTPTGISVPISLETLIEGVYVAPTAPPWFRDLVSSVSARYELSAAVRQSILVGSPVY